MAERDNLDRLLDAALSTYADPSPNLAPRVLVQVSARYAARTRRRQWLWAAGFASTAIAAILLLLIAPWRTLQPRVAPSHEAAVTSLPLKPVLPVEAPRTARHASQRAPRMPQPRIPAAAAPSPKEDFFPSPRPLSAEEQALIHLVTVSSAAQRDRLLAQQQQITAPLRIASISIPPIEPPTEGKE
jgi:hypothetical protein